VFLPYLDLNPLINGWAMVDAAIDARGERLGRERAEVESECVAHLPEGQEPGWVGGRGSHFHTLHEGVWHRLDPGLRAL